MIMNKVNVIIIFIISLNSQEFWQIYLLVENIELYSVVLQPTELDIAKTTLFMGHPYIYYSSLHKEA